MGLLDLPAPLFAAIDSGMAVVLPATLRLVAWGALAAVGTVMLYRLLSPQARIGQAKREAREARQRLSAFDGELSDAGPLIRRQFSAAFHHLGLVILPTLVSILPLLTLLIWLDTAYGRDYPPASEAPAMRAVPESLSTEWIASDGLPHVRVSDGEPVEVEIAMTVPVPVIEQRRWWNWLVANPLGYLPEDSGVERVEIGLPERTYLPFGPAWMRSWPALFLPVMLIVSLITYRWAKIE